MLKHLPRRLFVALVLISGIVASAISPLGGGARAQEGPAARVSASIDDLNAPKPEVRRAVAEALGRIGPATAAVPALTEAARDRSYDDDVRQAAVLALGGIGGPAAALPAILHAGQVVPRSGVSPERSRSRPLGQ